MNYGDSKAMTIIRRGFAAFFILAGLAALVLGVISIWADSNKVQWANTSGLFFGASCFSGLIFVFWQMARDI